MEAKLPISDCVNNDSSAARLVLTHLIRELDGSSWFIITIIIIYFSVSKIHGHHRMTWVGRDPKIHLFQTPHGAGTPSMTVG